MTKQSEKAVLAMQADVKNSGVVSQILLPEGMSYDDAIAALARKRDESATPVKLVRPFKYEVFDSARAVMRACSEICGLPTFQHRAGSFFEAGSTPTWHGVDTGSLLMEEIPLGELKLPGIAGTLTLAFECKNGMVRGRAVADTIFAHKTLFTQIFDRAEALLEAGSIYRGRAVRLNLRDRDGDLWDTFSPDTAPMFLRPKMTEEQLILDPAVRHILDSCVFAPVKNTELLRKNGLSVKRGALLEGSYGVGKTLTGTVLANLCERNNWTFVDCPDAEDIVLAAQWAEQYEPAVIWVEDIDRVLIDSERNGDIDEILNTLDGIKAKTREIMVVVTTNSLKNITKAALRPGRFDAVVHLPYASPKVAFQLLRSKLDSSFAGSAEDLYRIAGLMESWPHASIVEACNRARIIAVTRDSSPDAAVNANDLASCVISLKPIVQILKQEANEAASTPRQETLRALGEGIARGIATARSSRNGDNEESLEHAPVGL